MEIKLDMLPDQRWRGILYVDGTKIDTAVEPRPGCVVRTLLNTFQLTYGNPGVSELNVSIDEW